MSNGYDSYVGTPSPMAMGEDIVLIDKSNKSSCVDEGKSIAINDEL